MAYDQGRECRLVPFLTFPTHGLQQTYEWHPELLQRDTKELIRQRKSSGKRKSSLIGGPAFHIVIDTVHDPLVEIWIKPADTQSECGICPPATNSRFRIEVRYRAALLIVN
jgi:hypothetical protein